VCALHRRKQCRDRETNGCLNADHQSVHLTIVVHPSVHLTIVVHPSVALQSANRLNDHQRIHLTMSVAHLTGIQMMENAMKKHRFDAEDGNDAQT
jgi:hypothetical protein